MRERERERERPRLPERESVKSCFVCPGTGEEKTNYKE